MRIGKCVLAIVLTWLAVSAQANDEPFDYESDAQWYVISPEIGCIPTTEPDKFVSAMRVMYGSDLVLFRGNVNEQMVGYIDAAATSYSGYMLVQGALNCKMTYEMGKS